MIDASNLKDGRGATLCVLFVCLYVVVVFVGWLGGIYGFKYCSLNVKISKCRKASPCLILLLQIY